MERVDGSEEEVVVCVVVGIVESVQVVVSFWWSFGRWRVN